MTDRLPPHSVEMEQGLLGCILTSPNDCMNECVERMRDGKETFYELRHQVIYEELAAMLNERKGIDIITLQQALKDRGLLDQIGGIPYLSKLQDQVPSAANLSYYLESILEKWLLRRLIRVCTEAVGRVYDYEGEVDTLIDQVERDVLAIRPARLDGATMPSLVNDAINRIERIMTNREITGLPTGFPDLDLMTDGLQNGDLIVPAAYPGFGKSTLAANIVVHNALNGTPCAFLTAEMEPVKIVMRAIASEARVNFKARLERDVEKIIAPAHRLSKAPWYVENIAGMSITQVRAKARRLKQKHNIKLFVADYLQLLSASDAETREQEVAAVALGLKQMAMELGVPVIAPSQLNDDGKLRESRAIGQHASLVGSLESEGEVVEGPAQPMILRITKNREGETGTVRLTFLKEFTRFESASIIADEDIPNRPYAD